MNKIKVVHPKYQKLHDDMLMVFRAHGQDFTAPELLAVASQIVGQLMALQDASKPNAKERAIQLVMANIEIGNTAAIENAVNMTTKGNA